MSSIKDKTADSEKPHWYSIRAAARYLEVGEQTLYRWMREGRITYRKVGDSTRFLREDLENLVQVFPSVKEVGKTREICQYCHHPELVKGKLRSTGLNYFRPEKAKFWSAREANVRTEAWMCTRCGAVTVFGDVDKLALIRKNLKPERGDPTNEPDSDIAPKSKRGRTRKRKAAKKPTGG